MKIIGSIIVALVIVFLACLMLPIDFKNIAADPVAGRIDVLSKLASIIALLLAVAGAWIALRTFTITAATARKSHMQKLFADFLRFQFEYNINNGSTKNEELINDLASMKLYSLEAIFEWTQNERKILKSRFKFLNIDDTEVINEQIIKCWEETIFSHVKGETEATINNINKYKNCYNPEFIAFITRENSPPTQQTTTPVNKTI
ncbi:hypothetical protein [Bosea caraganae]|uniref:hypothetical protein n=1 Tax=Bosea caraganae TaxID=2763117 RepID=UPI0011C039C2|nr:hypothetical protein [Bosea caraganae]